MPYDASKIVLKKLIEATSNAQQKYSIDDASQMIVSRAFVDEGPVYRRFKTRAQGRIYKRKKQTSHLTIVVEVQS
jgi:large subunit ribosomal protein L22